MTPAGKVFLVDDDAAVLKALARVLTFAGCDVEPFQSGSAFLARLPYQHPACLVLDQRMPDVCGLEVQLALNRAGACLPVVYLTGYGDVPTSVQAMKEGAFDFLVKPVDDDRLLETVARALASSGQMLVASHERALFLDRMSRLTPRERQVCAFVITGLPNKQIAWEIGAAEKTVKIHRARVMEKLAVGSVAELVRLTERTNTWMQFEPDRRAAAVHARHAS